MTRLLLFYQKYIKPMRSIHCCTIMDMNCFVFACFFLFYYTTIPCLPLSINVNNCKWSGRTVYCQSILKYLNLITQPKKSDHNYFAYQIPTSKNIFILYHWPSWENRKIMMKSEYRTAVETFNLKHQVSSEWANNNKNLPIEGPLVFYDKSKHKLNTFLSSTNINLLTKY